MSDREPQIVYYAATKDDKIEVYCDVSSACQIVTLNQLNDLQAAIHLLNSVGCNISLRHVKR